MLSRVFFVLAAIASAAAWAPSRQMTMTSDIHSQIKKAVSVAVMGFALAGPMPALADGSVSKSTVYRARNNYGRQILDLEDAANKGNVAAFDNKKAIRAFDLFISGSTALNSKFDKETKASEISIEKKLYDAVKAKDSSKLKAAYDEFVKVADLKPEFKSSERGQTDSSGYSPTWGTSKQYIYQR